MNQHIHVDLVYNYFEDCLVSEAPWEFWEIKRDNHWYACTATDMYFGKNREYRRKKT